jgi:hypothetical protein
MEEHSMETRRTRKLPAFGAALTLLALLGTACVPEVGVAYPAPTVEVAAPPPAVVYEPVPVPRPGYFWVAGRWNWTGGRYAWLPGRWLANRPGYAWTPGRWVVRGPGRYSYVPGWWRAANRPPPRQVYRPYY